MTDRADWLVALDWVKGRIDPDPSLFPVPNPLTWYWRPRGRYCFFTGNLHHLRLPPLPIPYVLYTRGADGPGPDSPPIYERRLMAEACAFLGVPDDDYHLWPVDWDWRVGAGQALSQ